MLAAVQLRAALQGAAGGREDGAEANGPPWPLEKSRLHIFAGLGFELEEEDLFSIDRPGRKVPHSFAVWRKTKTG